MKTKTEKQLIKHWENKAREYKDYSDKLKSHLRCAHDKLTDLSVGLVPQHIIDNHAGWGHNIKLQYSAALYLRDNSNNIKEPNSWEFNP
jgi:hypothetical protein